MLLVSNLSSLPAHSDIQVASAATKAALTGNLAIRVTTAGCHRPGGVSVARNIDSISDRDSSQSVPVTD